MQTTGPMNPHHESVTHRSFEHEGAKILARISFTGDGPGLYVEGFDANGRYRAGEPTYLDGESSETGFSYLVKVLAKMTPEQAFEVFMNGWPEGWFDGDL